MPSLRYAALVVSLLGGSLLVSSDAVAQATLHAAGLPKPPVITQSVVNMMTDRVAGQANVATNGALDGVPVLNGFHFRFSNGDHELQRVGVAIATPSSADVFFRDHNADDPYKAEATWINVKGGGVRGQIFARGEGQFEVPIPTQAPAGHRLVLSGFGVTYFKDEDVQMIGIWLDEAKNVARVTLYRDAPSGAGAELGMAYRGPGIGKGKYLGTMNGLGCSSSSTATSFKSVGVQIQYAFIPSSIVAGDDYFTGSARAPASGKVFGPRAAIQGFEFLFDRKAHHLREIGVMPPLDGAATRAPTRVAAGEYIAFQDTNRDDPIKWAVKLVNLKP